MDGRQYIISILAQVKGKKLAVKNLQQLERGVRKLAGTTTMAKASMTGFAGAMGGIAKRALLTIPVWLVLRTAMMAVFRTIGSIISAQKDLQEGLARIRTVMHGTSKEIQKAMTEARETIVDMALNSNKSLKDLSEAFYFLQTSALTSEQALSAFEPTINAMIGTGTGAKIMARAMAGAFNTMGSSMNQALSDAEKFQRIAEVLTFTFATQDVEMNELVQGYGKLAPFVTGLEDGFETLVTILGMLNTKLLRGGRAGRLLGRTILQLTKNSDKLGEIFGITFEPDQPINFLNTIKQINKVLNNQGKITFSQQKALQDIFATRGATAPKLLLQDFKEIENALIRVSTESVGFDEKIKEIRMRTVPAQGKRFVNVLSSLTSEFLDGGAFGEKFAENLKNMNDEMAKGKDKARSYGEALAETITNWKTLNKAIEQNYKRKGIKTEGLFINPSNISLAKKLYKNYIDFLTKHATAISEKALNIEFQKGFEDIKNETKDIVDNLKAGTEIIKIIDGKAQKVKMTFEEQKLHNDTIKESQRAQLKILKALGVSELDMLSVKKQQLLTNRHKIDEDKYSLELRKLALEQEIAITSESNKQANSVRSLAVAYEKASGDERSKIKRAMELIQLDPNVLTKVIKNSSRDMKIVLDNLNKFGIEQNRAVTAYLVKTRKHAGGGLVTQQENMIKQISSLDKFASDFSIEAPNTFWNNWDTRRQTSINAFKQDFQEASTAITKTSSTLAEEAWTKQKLQNFNNQMKTHPSALTKEPWSKEELASFNQQIKKGVKPENIVVNIGDITVNAETKEDIIKVATEAVEKKIKNDGRYKKALGDELSNAV